MSNPQALCDELGLTIKSEFVPWSQSRNFEQDLPTSKKNLNWRVTLMLGEREVITTDYSAGIAHCPSYLQSARWTLDYDATIEHEVETGKRARPTGSGIFNGKVIVPDRIGVIWSLLMDSDVIDYSNFEDWADSVGFDSDSRKAEAIYKACLEIGLKMRNGIDHNSMVKLKLAFEDY